VDIKTLADLKRVLATPDVVVTLLGFYDVAREVAMPHKFLNEPRKVGKLQTDSVRFDTESGAPSWIYFGGAKAWMFEKNEAWQTIDVRTLHYRIELP